MTAYYNEIDPYAAQWLRNLIEAGHIAHGDVDERSIVDVRSDDLRGYSQCHFFAGIGGWSIALRLAGWDDDRPVWTGSCPCQPFSAAGAGKAADDGRHLWPAWFSLIAERRPPIVFGEQVEAAIGWGWLDVVCADLEAEGYACGASVLPACGVGAPHIRNRLWFVGHATGGGCEPRERNSGICDEDNESSDAASQQCIVGSSCGVANPDGGNAGAEGLQRGRQHRQRAQDRGPSDMADAAGGRFGEFGNAAHPRSGGHANGGFWSGIDWIPCTDGKARPIEPGSFPLANGVQRRPSKLRAYGNAIVPQVASQFIGASMRGLALSQADQKT